MPPARQQAQPAPAGPTPTPTGMLTVEITLDGQGNWKSPYQGRRVLRDDLSSHDEILHAASGLHRRRFRLHADIDRREQKSQPTLPESAALRRAAPQTAMTGQFGALWQGRRRDPDNTKMEVGGTQASRTVSYTETRKGVAALSPRATRPCPNATCARHASCAGQATRTYVIHLVNNRSEFLACEDAGHTQRLQGGPASTCFITDGDDLQRIGQSEVEFFRCAGGGGAQVRFAEFHSFHREFQSQVGGRKDAVCRCGRR